MFITSPEQLSAATKAGFDAQLAVLSALTSKIIENMEKVAELNLAAAKTAFEESNQVAKQLISAKDVQELLSLAAAQIQPNAEKAAAYARNLTSITNGAQAEFAKAAETHVAETNRKTIAFVDEISKNAPAGSENAIAMLKSAIGNASASYDQINKSAKQVAEAFEENLNTAVNQISQAAAKAAPRTPKKA